MLIEAAKGGHTNVVSYLLDYPKNVISVPSTDTTQMTPSLHDQFAVSWVSSYVFFFFFFFVFSF